jgi:hypothetical protein
MKYSRDTVINSIKGLVSKLQSNPKFLKTRFMEEPELEVGIRTLVVEVANQQGIYDNPTIDMMVNMVLLGFIFRESVASSYKGGKHG